MPCWRLLVLTLLVESFVASRGLTQSPVKINYQRDIRPILSNHCFKCHGPALQESGMRLDARSEATRRKVIVPGHSDASKLVQRVQARDDKRMPPPEAGDPLGAPQIDLLKRWIAEGAEYTPHWAFITPRLPALPLVKNVQWVRNPIDAFILARLEKEGMTPAPEADRSTLIRRLALDLNGLLPAPAEVDAFVKDTSTEAYEKLVDRLLASPHYGERQARHWLDLARYADSNGYTIDGKRSIWPWRDWLIHAFNQDMPFDQFTIEQLAGDLLPHPTQEQVVATGFHRNTSFNEEGGTNPEQFRVERTVDRTNTTGSVWLGLTVGCAQCHTHKYDPITHKEYYQLYAFFNSLDEPKLPLPTPEQVKRLQALKTELAQMKKQTAVTRRGSGELQKLVAELEKETHGGWRVAYPKLATSEQGAKLEVLDDRSVLAGGKVGASDTYIVQSVAPETGILTAIRLEALTHPSLPMKGPGRAENGNFVLSHFQFETDGVPHRFRKARADHSQSGYDVNEVLQNDPAKGWAVNAQKPSERNVDRQAIFYLNRPHLVREGQAFTFTLRFSQMPKGYALGRFRIAVTLASERFLDLPLVAQKLVLQDAKTRSVKDMEALQEMLARIPLPTEQVLQLQKEIKALEAQVDSTLVLRETAKPRVTRIQKRGNYLDLDEAVEPGTFAALNPLQVKDRQANRLDLARWLVAPEQPLTARVVANRYWQHYFGKGLVDTENDFGMQGALPTHPELLDWLALEFMLPTQHATASSRKAEEKAWSMKHMHRLIVTSATYRQSSHVRPELREKDAQNQWLARQQRLRLDAEILRDAALSASGLLTRKIGGPGVYPPQPPEIFAFTQNNHPWPESKGPERYRRGMYTFIWRQSQHPLLTTFDAPDAQTSCTRRNRSNTPLQALHLANDPTFMEIAQALAGRIAREAPVEDKGKISYIFKLCYCRLPSRIEEERLLQYLEQQRRINHERAWTMVARVLLNVDEFVTRE